MVAFDCLAKECPLLGPHLLEASAGTGKTFSIEHIFVRLVLEGIEVEQILAVTFTRAATRELKARIRTNLEKALRLIQSNQDVWEYLNDYLGSTQAASLLMDALSAFDRCQIFTIHGFCYRMLKEFAFEAKIGSLTDPDRGRKIPQKLKEAALDFLENGIGEDLICKEQMSLLLKQFESVDELVDRLLLLEKVDPTPSFLELFAKCKAALHSHQGAPTDASSEGFCIAALHSHEGVPTDGNRLLADFRALEKGYKVGVKGDFEGQVKALASLSVDSFRLLLKERGSLFDFLDPSNRKIKGEPPEFLHYPGFFDWARKKIAPLLKQKVLPKLQAAWNPIAERILTEEESFNPDEILEKMKRAIEDERFASLVREKYLAVIVDEFQDTDAIQWDVFQRLFLEQPRLKALYLVGDPKQSIYRFRKADVYTYLKARHFLGTDCVYQLDTNFRSSKPLVSALNALFSRDFLQLPKTKDSLLYSPVKAGANVESLDDEKGALHFFIAEGEPNPLFEELFLPYCVNEIERLQLKKCALLVKDRYQAEKALELLNGRGIAAVAKSHTPLGQTVAFQEIRELFEAVMNPYDQSAAKIVAAGSFGRFDLCFAEYKSLLEEKGMVPFARKFTPLSSDAQQIFELLFSWEQEEGFSFEGLKRFLKVFRHLDPNEGGRRRMEVDEEAIQIMTLHISKGLEFDVVFALALASRTPATEEEREELEAEKGRQLYVAMTRAKKRLYVPIALSKKEGDEGTHSPLELFARHFEGSFIDELTTLSSSESITLERVFSPFTLEAPLKRTKKEEKKLSSVPKSFHPSFLSSFTTLAKPEEHYLKAVDSSPGVFTLQTMPRGAETGIIIHKIFEHLFRLEKEKRIEMLDLIIEEELRFSSLIPWKEAIQEMARNVISMRLCGGFSLSEVDQFQVEMEFVFSAPPHFVKGFVDLVFYYDNKVYFLDWKTNWLEDYTPSSLESCMKVNDYGLQIALYKEAIERHFTLEFGGAFYLFIRGETSFFVGPNDVRNS